MSRNPKISARLRWNIGLALTVLLLAIVTIGRTSLLTSRSSFLRSPASALSNATPVDRGVGSVSFLTQVGGVAFGATAQPATAGVQITRLSYNPTRADGERLLVTLNGVEVVNFALSDWLLVPAARFAAGTQHACFTLFGTLEDPVETSAVQQQGYDILNYHSALENTLVGLRLFHADVLILSSASAELPTHDGSYILGIGEGAPNVTANQQALAALRPYMVNGSGEQIFRSYLITDYQQPITFRSQSGKLIMDGWPLWYLWRFSVADDELDAISDAVNDDANAQLNAEYQADAQVLSASALEAKYTSAYVDARFSEIYDDLISPQILQALPNESAALSTQIRAVGGVNPTVYAALTSFMRASALFRYVRLVAPEAYASFLGEIPCAVAPSLYTPIAYQPGTGLELDSGSVPGPQTCGAAGAGQAGTGQGGAAGGTTASGGTLAIDGTLPVGGTAATVGSVQTSVVGADGLGGAATAVGVTAASYGGGASMDANTGGTTVPLGEAGATVRVARAGGASNAASNGGHTNADLVPPVAGVSARVAVSAGSQGEETDQSADPSGCSCRVGQGDAQLNSWVLLALGSGLLLRRRGRKQFDGEIR